MAIARTASPRSRGIWPPAALVAVGVVCLFSMPAWAGAPLEQLRGSLDRVIRVLEDPKLKAEARAAERRTAIRKEAEWIFDFTETAKRALGAHWRSLKPSQQQEFASLFEDLLERAYILKIAKYSGERIMYLGDTVDGDLATVKTKFTTKQGTEIPVDYRLLLRGDRWLVYDVFVEGVSLVANYRTQFDRIMRTGSYDELVRRMKASHAEFGPPGGSTGKSATPRS